MPDLLGLTQGVGCFKSTSTQNLFITLIHFIELLKEYNYLILFLTLYLESIFVNILIKK